MPPRSATANEAAAATATSVNADPLLDDSTPSTIDSAADLQRKLAEAESRAAAAEANAAKLAEDLATANRIASDEAARIIKRTTTTLQGQPEPSSTTPTLAANSPVTSAKVKNVSKALFWFGTDVVVAPGESLLRNLKGAIVAETLTEAQFKTRSPRDWGVLEANEVVLVTGVPADVRAQIDEAAHAELQRLHMQQNLTAAQAAAYAARGVTGV